MLIFFSVLRIPVEKGAEDPQPFENLVHAVARFLEEVSARVQNVFLLPRPPLFMTRGTEDSDVQYA